MVLVIFFGQKSPEKRLFMKFVTVRDFRTKPGKIWKDLPIEQEIIITNKGKPIALLTPLSDSSLEDTIKSVRKARAIDAVKKMQQISIKNKNHKMSESEIDDIISRTRLIKK